MDGMSLSDDLEWYIMISEIPLADVDGLRVPSPKDLKVSVMEITDKEILHNSYKEIFGTEDIGLAVEKTNGKFVYFVGFSYSPTGSRTNQRWLGYLSCMLKVDYYGIWGPDMDRFGAMLKRYSENMESRGGELPASKSLDGRGDI
jgi:hypothetical protein